jgi:acetyl-CoA carboxylase biotin carboxyl carrier protein
MFEVGQIRSLVDNLARCGLDGLQIEQGGTRLRLKVSRDAPCLDSAEVHGPLPTPIVTVVTARAPGRIRYAHSGSAGEPLRPGVPIFPGQIVACLEIGDLLLPVTAQAGGLAGDWLVKDRALVGFGTPILSLTASP